MIKTQHPWQVGPTELIEFALERMHRGSDFDRRLAFLVLDLGVETLFKTFLKLPESMMQFQTKRGDRLEASEGNFHELLNGVQRSNPQRAKGFIFAHIEHYHNIRNMLYHQGNQAMAVPLSQLEGYAVLAVRLLKEYLDVDLSDKLKPPKSESKTNDDPLIDFIQVEISTGGYRIERRSSQSIYVFSLDKNEPVEPVKPFLRQVIDELSLPVKLTLKTGAEKNTRVLGKDVIDELKPNAWHGLTAGQKVHRDTLVSMLTGRIRAGKADEKNWAKVDFVRSLRHEVLVFRPIGTAFGNSPFNMKCWYTESGEPVIRQ